MFAFLCYPNTFLGTQNRINKGKQAIGARVIENLLYALFCPV